MSQSERWRGNGSWSCVGLEIFREIVNFRLKHFQLESSTGCLEATFYRLKYFQKPIQKINLNINHNHVEISLKTLRLILGNTVQEINEN